MASLAQQKSGELLARSAQAVHGVEPCPNQITNRLVPGIRNPYRGQFAGSVKFGQADSIAPIGLDPVTRSLRDQRGGDDNAFLSLGRHVTLNAVAARPGFVTNRKFMPSPPSLRSNRSSAVGVFAIRPHSRTSPRRPPAATATTIPSL
jgi:hypothetical protein